MEVGDVVMGMVRQRMNEGYLPDGWCKEPSVPQLGRGDNDMYRGELRFQRMEFCRQEPLAGIRDWEW